MSWMGFVREKKRCQKDFSRGAEFCYFLDSTNNAINNEMRSFERSLEVDHALLILAFLNSSNAYELPQPPRLSSEIIEKKNVEIP